MGSNLGKGRKAQQTPAVGRIPLHLANPPAAKLVWELPHSPCHHPRPPCPPRRATTPFSCASSAACLTTGKMSVFSHVEFENKISKRAPRSSKKPKQIAPKLKHLTGLAQSAATPEAESARGGSSTHQLQRRSESGTRNWGQDGNH